MEANHTSNGVLRSTAELAELLAIVPESSAEYSALREAYAGAILREGLAGDERVTESTLAEKLVEHHGDALRFCGPWRKWLAYRGNRWVASPTGAPVQQKAIRLIRSARGTAAERGDRDAVDALFRAEKRASRDSIVALAAHEAEVQIEPEDLDRHPMLLNVRNGTIDLESGKLREHQKSDYLTKLAPVVYDPNAVSSSWDSFLNSIFAGDKDLIEFIQRAAGYSLTGDVSEQVIFIAHGSGSNGKSTFLGALLAALGDYAMEGADDLLLASKTERHPTELADLFGRRFVACVETQDGQRFDESRLKRLTGGDVVKARRMREDFWRPERGWQLRANADSDRHSEWVDRVRGARRPRWSIGDGGIDEAAEGDAVPATWL